ncbi:Uncharacterized protein NEOC65_002030 [Neochlamydia sp. AcF65]|uniref:lipid-A-disaccharide synthase n=1 Tax=Neochlamydia sp. AcF65 TaxID=2795735 RepID=UPI001BC954AA|nr:lipid-A-disaccharide synthase [Neochlamydia sp. AcF65]MBS4166928.1 Uncharacterized protein [Neochlamydia sp. AcF65]
MKSNDNLKPHLFIFAGEPSGDLHGAHLVKVFKELYPSCWFSGVAGPALREEGIVNVMPMEKFAVMGFSDVIKALPSLYKQFYYIRDYVLNTHPELVIFIDYPGFNLRMAKALRKAGYKGKLVHYICPSVWAWGKKRIQHMAKTLDMLLTIYPFENISFKPTSLKVQYVGNPLQEYISQYLYAPSWKSQFCSSEHLLISIFPGSREAEIKSNLSKQLDAALLFQQENPSTTFGISCSNASLKPLIEKTLKKHRLLHTFIVDKAHTYDLMRNSHSAIAKSGTVTLELALHCCPTVVVYQLSNLNWLIAKFIIKLNLPYYCIVNILSGQRLFPELIAEGFTPKKVAKELENIHAGPLRARCLEGCQQIIELFQGAPASQNAAHAIHSLLS